MQWKYTVAKSGNVRDGQSWDEFRISRSRKSRGGNLIITRAVMDVFGKRRIALAIARALNKFQPIKSIR